MSVPTQNATIKSEKELIEELQQIFDKFNHTEAFGRVAANLKVTQASVSSITVEFVLCQQHVNSKQTLHGGLTAALTDIVTSRAVGAATDDLPRASLDLSVSYMMPAKLGETVTIEAICLKIGRSVAFTEAIFRRKSDNVMIAKGTHNMSLMHHLRKPVSQ
uniref:Acyl-coenzyme A thioesterase 13 n=1 Tax=Ditylenchus dipsaci TaxID=166011 RepID=A0A915D529_9BILA